jgi:hypothetical protein
MAEDDLQGITQKGPLGYFFAGRDPKDPLSYQSLLARRKIAEALLNKRSPYPTTIGQGLTYLGESLAERRAQDRADEAAGIVDKREDALLGGKLAVPTVSPAAAAGVGASPAAATQAAPPLPPVPPGNLPATAPMAPQPAVVSPAGASPLVPRSILGGSGIRSELTPEQAQSITDNSLPRSVAPLTPQQVEVVTGANPLVDGRTAITRAALAQRGVIPPGPTVGREPPSPTMLASLESDDIAANTQLPEARQQVAQLSPNAAVAERFGNPPIVAPDIKPMPTREGSTPELEPIPGPRDLTVPSVGAEPVRPPPRGPTQRMLDMIPYMNENRFSPQINERAKMLYKLEESVQKQIEEREQKDFELRHGLWKEREIKREQRAFDVPKTRLEDQQARLNILKSQLDAARNPLEIAKLTNEIAKQKREMATPETVTLEGAQYERPYDPVTNTFGPLTLIPGSPKPKVVEPTEGQASAIQFVLRTQRDLDNADTNLRFGKALTDRREASINALLPRGVANTLLSEDYKNARDAYTNFMAAMLNRVSGASVTQSEDLRNSPAFIPEAGDTDERLRAKAQRRRDMVEAVKAGGGQITYDTVKRIMDSHKETTPSQPEIQEGRTRTNRRTGEQQKYINGTWVPVR